MLELLTPAAPLGPGVLFVHGWRSSRESPRPQAEALAGRGLYCGLFDLPGMGTPDADLTHSTRAGFLEGVIDAYDELCEEVGSVYVVGASFGAYLTCLLSAKRRISRMVLRVPADFEDRNELPGGFAHAVDHKIGRLPERDDPITGAQRALARFTEPVMIVESGRDELISPSTVNRFRGSAPHARYERMETAEHSLKTDEDRAQYAALLVSFLT